DRPLVAALDQYRQAAAVVDVGVTEHHRVQGVDIEGKGLEVAALVLFAALDHAAVQQQAMTVGLDLVAGTGDLTGRAVELHPHRPSSFAGNHSSAETAKAGRAGLRGSAGKAAYSAAPISSSRCGAGNTSRITQSM